MKVLVTGGAGFLGSHIVEALLHRGDDVIVFDRRLHGKSLSDDVLKKVRAIEGDVLDADAVRDTARGCTAIFHCAAMVGVAAYSGQPARTMEVEQIGLRNICNAALAGNNARVIYASSSAVYGQAGGDVSLDETLMVAPVSNYGNAKRFNEIYLAADHAERGLRSAALRIFNMYGPRQDDRLVIPRFIRCALSGANLNIFGDGMQTRDFVYVGDVVKAALACGDNVSGCEIVNVCSGREVAVRDLAGTIIRLTGSTSSIMTQEKPMERAAFEVQRCFGSRDRLQEIVGSFAPFPLELGLQNTIASIRAMVGGAEFASGHRIYNR